MRDLLMVLGTIGRPLLVCAVLAVPLVVIWRSDRKLTWTGAIGLGTLISAISLILIAELPSRILYMFSAQHAEWEKYTWLRWALRGQILGEQDTWAITADVIANGVQTTLFIVIIVVGYIWGKRRFGK